MLENCTELRRLKVCFDGEFKSLVRRSFSSQHLTFTTEREFGVQLSLASSFAACFHLHQFLVSIPLSHTPSLQPLTPQTYHPFLPLSPTSSPSSSPSSELPSNSHLPSSISSLLPATRDWRRFLKKTHSLQSIDWVGRGGIGRFRFGKVEGKGLMRIEFEPTRPLPLSPRTCHESGEEVGGRREREDSWISTISSGGSSFSSSGIGMRRRSSGGNTSMSSPGSPSTSFKTLAKGGGGGERYGSIDAAFFSPSSSPSSAPRRKTEGFFGAIGGGGGSSQRRSSTVIGQGWSGFSSTKLSKSNFIHNS